MTKRKHKIKNSEQYNALIDKYVVKKNKPLIRWKILDKDKAVQYGIRTLPVGDEVYLSVNFASLPEEVTSKKLVSWLSEQGIAINDLL